ncbi:BRO-N domain-containing protein [Maridesulfovibrio bastinii]|uniref:BRO-N domain-containing protein n=1 Tax=Maridesulfovibrio bastinii TaxID=47157 RepID=UPI000429F4DC|nr:BRO family protein [Maridesulfovibrio bastinii]
MPDIIPFDFGQNVIRVHQDAKGDPWFVAKDVCEILDLKNTSMTIDPLDDDERAKLNLGRQGETNIISESGLYSLIFKSRKPEAKKFRKWITAEVLPALRRSGSYALNKKQPEALESLGAENFNELYDLITKWSLIQRGKGEIPAKQILPATLRELMNFLGKTPDTPLKDLNSAETTHAIHYFKMQIAIQKELPIETEEEKESARQRSEKARLAARARWDKVKS